MRALLLVGLMGCDSVYGLNGRMERDAASADGDLGDSGVDEMVDAPGAGCPASGAPTFALSPTPVITNCIDYTTSSVTGTALMTCADVFNEASIGQGNALPLAIEVEKDQTITAPRIAPEGAAMYVVNSNGMEQSIRVYRRSGGQWAYTSTPTGLPTATMVTTLSASPPTVGPDRRILIHRGVTSVFAELRENDPDDWAPVREYTVADLGVMSLLHPSMTPDGLHLVFAGTPIGGSAMTVRYARRSSTSVKFDSSIAIDVGFENVLYPHMTADCGRLFFWHNNTIYYVETPPN